MTIDDKKTSAPRTDKKTDQKTDKVKDLPQKNASGKDEQVKGGAIRER
jgi:hypothetical protein